METVEARVLQGTAMDDAEIMNFTVAEANINTIWLDVGTIETLTSVQVKVSIQNYYLFAGKTLQNVNATKIL